MTSPQQTPRFVVLAAVDDGPLASEVLRVGANLARKVSGGELHVLHVVEDLPPPVSMVPPPPGMGITAEEIRMAARARIDELCAAAQPQFGGRIAAHLAAGHAREEILRTAAALEADVVMVGSHGRTGIKRILLGSVAEAVVRKACCAVVVVRPKDYHAFAQPDIERASPDSVVASAKQR
jgi:nucleotide-binding universal stress UspA family protein